MARRLPHAPARLVAAPCLVLAATLLGGCTDEAGGEGGSAVPTSVSVDPELFLGAVRCSEVPGDLQTYVATVFDLGLASTDGDSSYEPFALPSSPPTSCAERALFRFVVPGHVYRAEVDAYEVGLADAGALVPAGEDCADPDEGDSVDGTGATASGSRHMCTPGPDGDLVPIAPRWTTRCGDDRSEAAVSVENREVRIRGCDALADHGLPPPPALQVDPNVTLGDLGCVSAGGLVASFDIVPQGSALPAITGVACGSVPAPFDQDIVPGRRYDFRIEGRETDADGPTWGASCFAVGDAERTAVATCTPLTDRGVLHVPVASAGTTCPEGATVYRVELTTAATHPPTITDVGPFSCAGDATIEGVVAGGYSVVVQTVDGTPIANCSADVPPGATADAFCGLAR